MELVTFPQYDLLIYELIIVVLLKQLPQLNAPQVARNKPTQQEKENPKTSLTLLYIFKSYVLDLFHRRCHKAY